MLSENTKVKVRSPAGDTAYFDIVVGVLQRDTLAPYLFIICLHYMLRMFIDLMKENDFILGKEGSRIYPAQTIADTKYTDDIALQANSPAQSKYQLHSLKWTVDGINLHVNRDQVEYMCFSQRGDISALNGVPLKLVDKFTNHESSVLSTENDISAWLAKAWTAIDWLSVI